MGEDNAQEYHYLLAVRNKQPGSSTVPEDISLVVSSPVPLSPDELSRVLFEKIVQRDYNSLANKQRERDFVAYRDNELSIRGPLYRKIFAEPSDVVCAYVPGTPHKEPQFYAPLRPVTSPPSGLWTVRYSPGIIEGLIPVANGYLAKFDALRDGGKEALLTDVILHGGPWRIEDGIDARVRRLVDVERAQSQELGLPYDARQDAEVFRAIIADQCAFARELFRQFTKQELAEMVTFCAIKSSEVVSLAQMVQHTSTVYSPEPVRSYAVPGLQPLPGNQSEQTV